MRKRITFSADEAVIEQARAVAKSMNTSLNELFPEWLKEISGENLSGKCFDDATEQLSHPRSSSFAPGKK